MDLSDIKRIEQTDRIVRPAATEPKTGWGFQRTALAVYLHLHHEGQRWSISGYPVWVCGADGEEPQAHHIEHLQFWTERGNEFAGVELDGEGKPLIRGFTRELWLRVRELVLQIQCERYWRELGEAEDEMYAELFGSDD